MADSSPQTGVRDRLLLPIELPDIAKMPGGSVASVAG
jgi:hypothetical protein